MSTADVATVHDLSRVLEQDDIVLFEENVMEENLKKQYCDDVISPLVLMPLCSYT